MRTSCSVCILCILSLAICIQFVCAAPADNSTSLHVSSATSETRLLLSHSNTPTSSSSPRHPGTSAGDVDKDRSSATATKTSSSHSILILPTARPQSDHPTWTHSAGSPITHSHSFPPSLPSEAPTSSRHPNGPNRHHQSAVAIAFEVIAGVLGLVIALTLARCVYAYKRAPPLDRVSVYVHRHNLEREMEEMERDRMATFTRALESFRWRPPPPPYQHAPAYETAVNAESDGSIDWGRPTEPSLSHRPP